jgi:hypothetical protein
MMMMMIVMMMILLCPFQLLSYIYLVYLSTHLSIYLSVYLPIYLSIYIHISIYWIGDDVIVVGRKPFFYSYNTTRGSISKIPGKLAYFSSKFNTYSAYNFIWFLFHQRTYHNNSYIILNFVLCIYFWLNNAFMYTYFLFVTLLFQDLQEEKWKVSNTWRFPRRVRN